MFTGIIKGLGTIVSIEDRDNFRVVAIETHALVTSPQVGASVAVSGVCLTITHIIGSTLTFEVMQESLVKTTLGTARTGDRVNIETPLRIGDELGGHIVQGHVDGTAKIVEKVQAGENTRMRFEVSVELARFIIDKGSVALDGISLTVCKPSTVNNQPTTQSLHPTFDVWLLPLTLERTTLGLKQVGELVNLETDYLMRAFAPTT